MIRILIIFLFFALASISRGEVKYNKDVLPILAAKCFSCHGEDKVKRKANLRLDDKNSAYAKRDGVQAILPGSINGSELIKSSRIIKVKLCLPLMRSVFPVRKKLY